jgi:hypothetical protein
MNLQNTPNTIQDSQSSQPSQNIQLIMNQCGVTFEAATALYTDTQGDVVQAIACHLNPHLVSDAPANNTGAAALTPTQETLKQLRCIANEKDTMLAQRRTTAPPHEVA